MNHTLKILLTALSASVLFFLFIMSAFMFIFTSTNSGIYSLLLFIIILSVEALIVAALWGFIKKKTFLIPVCSVLFACAAVWGGIAGYNLYLDSIPTVSEGSYLLSKYAPYAENTKAVTLNEQSDLLLTDNLPVMDGATALYPIYSSFAKAVYPKEAIDNEVDIGKYESVLKCTTTTYAYKSIVNGKTDIIFAAPPSDKQKEYAIESGVELVYTPIGKEAFVFFVNAENPIDNITVDEIKKIYSGQITDWEDLGVDGLGNIKAFQRDAGSGSQSTLEKLMAGEKLMTPPKEDVIGGMGEIIEKTADYKNYKNAIGYSFRFYSTEMVKNNQIKLLSVNGVEPTLENIENGTYPLASYFYAVTRKDADENTQKLLKWVQGEQGQKIIELIGYTPLGN